MSRRLTVWAQPPLITVLAHSTSCRQSAMTSVPWSQPTTSMSNCTLPGSKGTRATYLRYLQRQPDDFPGLHEGHTIQQVVHWEIQDAATTRLRTGSANSQELGRHVPPAAELTAATSAIQNKRQQ